MISSRLLDDVSIEVDNDEDRREDDIRDVTIGRKAATVVTALCRCNVIQSNAIITMISDNVKQRLAAGCRRLDAQRWLLRL